MTLITVLLIPLLVLVWAVTFSLTFNELIVVAVCSVFLMGSNYSILKIRLHEKWLRYIFCQLTICLPTTAYVFFCYLNSHALAIERLFSIMGLSWLASSALSIKLSSNHSTLNSSFFEYFWKNKQNIINLLFIQLLVYVSLGIPRLAANSMSGDNVVEMLFILSLFGILFFIQDIVYERRRPILMRSSNIFNDTRKLSGVLTVISMIGIVIFALFGINPTNHLYSGSLILDNKSIVWVAPFCLVFSQVTRIKWILTRSVTSNALPFICLFGYVVTWIASSMLEIDEFYLGRNDIEMLMFKHILCLFTVFFLFEIFHKYFQKTR